MNETEQPPARKGTWAITIGVLVGFAIYATAVILDRTSSHGAAVAVGLLGLAAALAAAITRRWPALAGLLIGFALAWSTFSRLFRG